LAIDFQGVGKGDQVSYRTLDVASGLNGGAIQLLQDPGRARNINVTVLNPTNATHAAFFGRSRRELAETPPVGIAGFAIVAVANTVATATIGGVAYTSFILQGWTGELWAAADATGVVQVDVFEGSGTEK
jgi:hypothetical protein